MASRAVDKFLESLQNTLEGKLSGSQPTERPPEDPPQDPASNPASLRSKIIGTWELVAYIGFGTENDVIYPMGVKPRGQLIYSPDGYMSALLQEQDIEPYAKDWKSGTTEEMANAAKKTMAYGGPFYIEHIEEDKDKRFKKERIVHQVRVGLPANLVNTLQVRSIHLRDSDSDIDLCGGVLLEMGPVELVEWEGKTYDLHLYWRKLVQNNATQAPVYFKELNL